MKIVKVNLKEKSYPIYITTDFSEFSSSLLKAELVKKVVIITDKNVNKFQSSDFEKVLTDNKISFHKLILEPGENSKNLQTMEKIYDFLYSLKLDRKITIIALGGGVIGDMAGFAAATFLRGVNFVQVPTTLLAQADSSVGGKTGIDFKGSKNIIGAFYQPKFVYINVNTLKTLDLKEIQAGLAETIKHGIIRDKDFYIYLKRNIENIFSFNEDTLMKIAENNCRIKGYVVEKDEKETGLRAILNFGHTFGHAIETTYNFKYTHGECVALGMIAACYMSEKMGIIAGNITDDIKDTLKKAGLPTCVEDIDETKVYQQMFFDKKLSGTDLNFILPIKISKVIKQKVTDEKIIKESIALLKK